MQNISLAILRRNIEAPDWRLSIHWKPKSGNQLTTLALSSRESRNLTRHEERAHAAPLFTVKRFLSLISAPQATGTGAPEVTHSE